MKRKAVALRVPLPPLVEDRGEVKPSLYACHKCWRETKTQATVGLAFTVDPMRKGLIKGRINIYYQNCLGLCYARNHATFTGADGRHVPFCHLTKTTDAEAVMEYAVACLDAGKTLAVPTGLEKKVDQDAVLRHLVTDRLVEIAQKGEDPEANWPLASEENLRRFHKSFQGTSLGGVSYEQLTRVVERLINT